MYKLRRKTPTVTPAQAARLAEAQEIMAASSARLLELETERLIQERKRAHELKELEKSLKATEKAASAREWSAWLATWGARVVPFLPLFLVNTMAVFGQLGWGRENLTQVGASPDDLARWVVALMFAATLESIALFLAYYANRALDRGDSATALYLAAFGVAGLVAGVNYSHYADGEEITFLTLDVPGPSAMAVVFALCSVASPWLWRIKHRDANRNKLHALGVIDAKAVRLGMARKIWHPVRSFKVMWHATWSGETNPAKAVADWEEINSAKIQARTERAATGWHWRGRKALNATETVVEVVQEETPTDTGADELEAPQAPERPALETAPHTPGTWEAKYPAGWEALTKTHEAGNPISQRQLSASYTGGNRHHARALIAEHTEWRLINSGNGSRPSA